MVSLSPKPAVGFGPSPATPRRAQPCHDDGRSSPGWFGLGERSPMSAPDAVQVRGR